MVPVYSSNLTLEGFSSSETSAVSIDFGCGWFFGGPSEVVGSVSCVLAASGLHGVERGAVGVFV